MPTLRELTKNNCAIDFWNWIANSRDKDRESLRKVLVPFSYADKFWHCIAATRPNTDISVDCLNYINTTLQSGPPQSFGKEIKADDDLERTIAHLVVAIREDIEDSIRRFRTSSDDAQRVSPDWRFLWQVVKRDTSWLSPHNMQKLLEALDMVPFLVRDDSEGLEYYNSAVGAYFGPNVPPVEATIQAKRLKDCLRIHETNTVLLANEKRLERLQQTKIVSDLSHATGTDSRTESDELKVRLEKLNLEWLQLNERILANSQEALSLMNIIENNNILPPDDLDHALAILSDIEIAALALTHLEGITDPINLDKTHAAIAAIDEQVLFFSGAERIPNSFTMTQRGGINHERKAYIVRALQTPKGTAQFSAYRKLSYLRSQTHLLLKQRQACEAKIANIREKLAM